MTRKVSYDNLKKNLNCHSKIHGLNLINFPGEAAYLFSSLLRSEIIKVDWNLKCYIACHNKIVHVFDIR